MSTRYCSFLRVARVGSRREWYGVVELSKAEVHHCKALWGDSEAKVADALGLALLWPQVNHTVMGWCSTYLLFGGRAGSGGGAGFNSPHWISCCATQLRVTLDKLFNLIYKMGGTNKTWLLEPSWGLNEMNMYLANFQEMIAIIFCSWYFIALMFQIWPYF